MSRASGTRSPRVVRALVRASVLAAVLALCLAGCVGIPRSSGVNLGPAVQDGNDQPAGADVPGGPTKGATQDEVLTDFMQAVVSPENDYGIARLYLTADADHSWNPTKSVLIRDGSPTTQDDASGSTLYTVTTRASINDQGIYSEQSTSSSQSLSFAFEKVKGQWRISSLADGIVVSRTNFVQSFTDQTLYFFDPNFHYLIPDTRWFPTGTTEPTRAVSALLGGPAPVLDGGVVVSAFPQGTKLQKAVELRGSTAAVDLTASSAVIKPLVQSQMLKQLNESLASTSVTNVAISVGGAPLQISHQAPGTVAVAVDTAALVRKGAKFGFSPQLTPIGKITAQVAAVDARAVTLSRDQSTAAALGKNGVYLLSNTAAGQLVDDRAGLIEPSIDPFGYVWSVPAHSATAIHVTGADGKSHTISAPVPRHSTMVALQVSHDGARVLMYLKTSAGPRLLVAGVIRRDNLPTSLGVPLDLPVSDAVPIDATWVDAGSVAALAESDSNGTDSVTSYTIGGTAGDASTTADAVNIAGGNGSQLRVITSKGQVLQLRSSGWQQTDITASVLATQQ